MRALLFVSALALISGCKKKSNDAAKPPADAAVAAAPIDAAPAPIDAAEAAEAPPLMPPTPEGKPGIQIKGVEYEGYEAKMLPAVRDDGSQFAAVTQGDDGGRGYLELALVIVDSKSGKATDTKLLVDPDETFKAQGEDGTFSAEMLDKVKARTTEANALLDKATWRALEAATAPDDDPEAPITAAGIAWTLGDKLNLTGTRDGKKVFDKTYTQLTGKPAPKGSGDDDMCPDIVVLEALHVDAKSGQALVTFGRQSGHNCGAPFADFAVIALPK